MPQAQIIQAPKKAGPDLAGDGMAATKKEALLIAPASGVGCPRRCADPQPERVAWLK